MLIIAFLSACKNDGTLRLEKYTLKSDDSDTVAHFVKDDLYLLEVRDYGFLGDFRTEYVFIGEKDSVGYKIDCDDLQIEFSKKYLGLVKEGVKSYGWFNINQHKVNSSLPKVDSIIANLEKIFTNRLVEENNGIFKIYDSGKLLKKLNLGEFLIRTDSVNYDELDYGIYQVKNARLVKINNDGSKLLEQVDGLYFVPLPGFNAVVVKKLSDILPEIDATLNMRSLPKEIWIK